MTVQSETQSNLPVITTVEIVKPEGISLPATHRCDLDGVQAWVEVEVAFTRTTKHLDAHTAEDVNETAKDVVLLCAHHFAEHEEVLKKTAIRIIDYRDTLYAEERGERGGSV